MNKENTVSYKGLIVKLHGYLTNEAVETKGNKLLLLTPAGLISGDYSPHTEQKTNGTDIAQNDIPIMMQHALISQAIKQVEEDETERVFDETCAIILTDVTITNGNTNTKMPTLLVFADQIIGVSFGNPQPQ